MAENSCQLSEEKFIRNNILQQDESLDSYLDGQSVSATPAGSVKSGGLLAELEEEGDTNSKFSLSCSDEQDLSDVTSERNMMDDNSNSNINPAQNSNEDSSTVAGENENSSGEDEDDDDDAEVSEESDQSDGEKEDDDDEEDEDDNVVDDNDSSENNDDNQGDREVKNEDEMEVDKGKAFAIQCEASPIYNLLCIYLYLFFKKSCLVPL